MWSKALTYQLKPGRYPEYKKAHDEVWPQLAQAAKWDGSPPKRLIERSLLLETDDGMWLHEALRERLLREVGKEQKKRKKRLSKD